MSKKLRVFVLAAVSAAMFALPAVASAGNWHLEPTDGSTTGPNITITGGAVAVSTTSGNSFKGKALHGTAVFNANSTTTGTLNNLIFTEVSELGVLCEQTVGGVVTPKGTVDITPLTFHLEKIDTETPGILLKPNNAEGHFATIICFGVKTVISGNGILADVTNACSSEIELGTATWQTTGVTGQQKYKQVTTTGTSWDLTTTASSGSATAAMEASGTLKLSKKSKINCTLP